MPTDAKKSPYVEIANHSTTHADDKYQQYYKNPAKILDGFKKANTTLGITGGPHVNARLPGRNTWRTKSGIIETAPTNGSDSGKAANLLAQNGFNIIGWDLEWRMTKKGIAVETPQQMLDKVKKMQTGGTKGKNGIVILTHDVMFKKSSGGRLKLEQFISLLKSSGFKMDFISKYRGVK